MMMMTRTLLSLLFVITAMSVTAQDVSFSIEVTTPKKAEPMTIKVASSGSKMVMQPMMGAEGSMRIIIDNTAKTQHLLMSNNGQKMAMLVDAYDQMAAAEKVTKEPVVTVTKETKMIDGMKCTKVIAETDEAVSTLWVTQESGLTYQDLSKIINSSRGNPASRDMLPSLKGVNGFPIQIVSKNKTKDEPVVMNIRNISRTKVDQSLFSMDGYKVTDMRKVK